MLFCGRLAQTSASTYFSIMRPNAFIYFVGYVAVTRAGMVAVARHGGHGISVFELDLENLSAWRPETKVRNVERAVGSKGEAGGEEEWIVGRAVNQDLLLAVGQYAKKTTHCRYGL